MSRSSGLKALVLLVVTACTSGTSTLDPTTTTTTLPSTIPTPGTPRILQVEVAESEAATYSPVEVIVDLEADFDNPFDQREVSLDTVFTTGDGATLEVPGFWDGEESWKVRFTAPDAGVWDYTITVSDHRGPSEPATGSINVAASDHPGFLSIGDQVDPSYSPRYFAYEDGTAWYGRGHADLDMSLGGASPDGQGLRKFTEMTQIGENYEMWWPMWGNNFIQESYDRYSTAQLGIIDFVVRDAESKGISLVFTIWGHQFLRTPAHDWPDERWNFNGFSELTDIEGFFTDPEAWAWQENLYRYIIARWSSSPAITMWQTVTEINGTESYEETDPWHEKVNSYFQENDPYRHLTTATKSGAEDWPEGHEVMDVPQVHLYHVFGENPIADTPHFAEWTTLMWDRAEKPNWIGEYGNRVQNLYPEFMHNANWVTLATGAAMTPTEWNDGNAFGSFDDEMRADMARFAAFVDATPLVTFDPEQVSVQVNHDNVRAWGVVGPGGGVVWVQDFALEEGNIDDMRADDTIRRNLVATVDALDAGLWAVTPYDTWTGTWLEAYEVECPGGPCNIPLPEFHSDVALRLQR